jgi:hypothetical protein
VSLELHAAVSRADLLAEALGGPVEVVERAPGTWLATPA